MVFEGGGRNETVMEDTEDKGVKTGGDGGKREELEGGETGEDGIENL